MDFAILTLCAGITPPSQAWTRASRQVAGRLLWSALLGKEKVSPIGSTGIWAAPFTLLLDLILGDLPEWSCGTATAFLLGGRELSANQKGYLIDGDRENRCPRKELKSTSTCLHPEIQGDFSTKEKLTNIDDREVFVDSCSLLNNQRIKLDAGQVVSAASFGVGEGPVVSWAEVVMRCRVTILSL